jgi:hypothetical protein
MGRYGQAVDRDSAREMLARKLESGAQAEEQERQARAARTRVPARPAHDARDTGEARTSSRPAPRARGRSPRQEEKGVVEQVVTSSVFKQFARTAGREIVRGLFGAARRRR